MICVWDLSKKWDMTWKFLLMESMQEQLASQLTKTDWHYDRGGQGYPEGYDTSKATDKNKTKYDRDGAKVGVVTIGGTQPVNVVIKFHGINASKCCFHHWCLRPTKNCY